MSDAELWTPSRALVVGPSWVGDAVMAQVLYKILKQRYPHMQLDVLAPETMRPLLARMPEITDVLPSPFRHGELKLRKRYYLGRALRVQRYDWALVLPGSWKSALVPYCAHIPKRTGYRGEQRYGLLNDLRHLDKEALPLMIQRYAALAFDPAEEVSLTRLPKPALSVDPLTQKEACQKHQLSLQKPVLTLCPGAEFGPAKRWPTEYYASVAKHYLQKGWQVWLMGAGADQALAKQIQERTGHECVDLTGKTTLGEAIDLMALSALVVTNDSGLMHIAAGLKRPIVAVYGSTSPSFTPPLHTQTKIVAIKDLECRPCFKRTCRYKHLRCLKDLSAARVLDAADELLSQR